MQVNDGADARDFDDAVGCVEEGDVIAFGCRLRMLVTTSVLTRLDAEAYQRGTSVYFPHSVCLCYLSDSPMTFVHCGPM